MGFFLSKLMGLFYGKEEIKAIIVGLDNAGKTTTLYKLFFFYLFPLLTLTFLFFPSFGYHFFVFLEGS